MGMAASQARFLTLTARKSNVEYEGQQVNQQRTSLSNESAGLFNKMMELEVPTPPSATDFYNTRYTFNAKGADYSITESSPRNDGTYNLKIAYTATVPTALSNNVYGSVELDSDGNPAKITPVGSETCTIEKLTKGEDGKYYYTDAEGKHVDANVDYIVKESKDESEVYYRYKNNNIYYYASKTNMDAFIQAQNAPSDGTAGAAPQLTTYYATTKQEQQKLDAIGTFPSTTSEGRFEELLISDVTTDDENIKNALVGTIFDLSLTQVQDDEGYAEAMKDYEYQKMLYERTINDINAQTEIIQQQDRTLELRLKQLDTEQNALNTELEAVKKVIEQNVEATFKTFA